MLKPGIDVGELQTQKIVERLNRGEPLADAVEGASFEIATERYPTAVKMMRQMVQEGRNDDECADLIVSIMIAKKASKASLGFWRPFFAGVAAMIRKELEVVNA